MLKLSMLPGLLGLAGLIPTIAAAVPPTSFRPHADFATAGAPVSVAIADFNRDGKADIAAANLYSSSISILMGDGTGGFGTATDIATGDYPWFVAAGDLNADGNPDLVSANDIPNTLSVLLGDGAGGFGPKTDFATGVEPLHVAIADLNRDGRPDLVASNWIASTVSVLLGDGAGGFGPNTEFATGTNPRSVAVGDLNGDGIPDLAVANWTAGSVSVLPGDGVGGFGPGTEFPTGLECASVAIGDLNGDGKADLAVANFSSNSASVLLGDGVGGFAPHVDFAGGANPHSVAVADFNGDGVPDLALANLSEHAISVLPGDGIGGFGPLKQFATGQSPRRLAVGNMNGDCKPDVVVASLESGAVSVLVNATGASPEFLFTWGSAGTGDGQFIEPDAIAVHPNGAVYVGEYTGTRMQKFTADGVFLLKWGSEGTGDGEFNGVGGLAVGPDGSVYVNDVGNHRIQKFDADGNFQLKWGSYGTDDGQFWWATLPAVDASGNVYVPDNSNNRVQKFDADGNFLLKWGSYGTGDGQFQQAQSAAVDGGGNVYILEHEGGRVQKFTADGDFILKWGSPGSAEGQFMRPQGIAVDGDGKVYVSDLFNSRVQRFTGAGEFLGAWGSNGSGDGEFDWPVGIAIGANGMIYVVDHHNSRIQAFGFTNHAPVLSELPARTIPEGVPFTLSATACDFDLPADHLTYRLEPGAPQGLAIDPVSGVLSWTPTEAQGPGTYQVAVGVRDEGDPPLEDIETFTLAVEEVNLPPTLALPLTLTVDEGATVSFPVPLATDADLPANPLTFALLPPSPPGAVIDQGTGLVAWPTADNGAETFSVSVSDGRGGTAAGDVAVTIDNVAPSVIITAPPPGSIHAVGDPVTLTGTFTDPGLADTHTAQWTFDSISVPASVNPTSHTVQSAHAFTAAGVYVMTLGVTDDDGGTGVATQVDGVDAMVVVYDPSAGFVTGHGWMDSPPGACPAQPAMAGSANFGFVSRYQKGATAPTGETEFKFRAGDLDFHSTSYEWLVIAGGKAQYKGTGEINRAGVYGFMLTTIDGAIRGGSDRLRMKIWELETAALVYDNQIGSPNGADPTTALGAGTILIQKTGGAAAMASGGREPQPQLEADPEPEVLAFGLEPNRPNPFSDLTNITFTLSGAGRVRLGLCDVAGREIARLLDEERPPGRHAVTWTGRDAEGRRVAAGVYFYRLEVDPARGGAMLTALRKLVVLQ